MAGLGLLPLLQTVINTRFITGHSAENTWLWNTVDNIKKDTVSSSPRLEECYGREGRKTEGRGWEDCYETVSSGYDVEVPGHDVEVAPMSSM